MRVPQQRREELNGTPQHTSGPPIPTPGCSQPTCFRVRVKSGGCPAWLVFVSKSVWLWLSKEMGPRVMFIFSKAVEISPVYCQRRGAVMGHDVGPALYPRSQAHTCSSAPQTLAPHTHLADVEELIQGHTLVQVQCLPQRSISLALPAGWGHGDENGAGEGHQKHVLTQVGQAAPIPGSIRGC